eukprot:4038005-Pyramimonas_sp.AAC.1
MQERGRSRRITRSTAVHTEYIGARQNTLEHGRSAAGHARQNTQEHGRTQMMSIHTAAPTGTRT